MPQDPPARPDSRTQGFSALELIVVLAVASVSLALTVPSLTRITNDASVTATSRLLHAHLALARSTALSRNRNVVVCSARGSTCDRDNDWSNGWWVFVDSNQDGDLDGGDVKLAFGQPSGPDIEILQGSRDSKRWFVRYKPSGWAWPNSSFSICAGSTVPAIGRAVVVYYTGRARTAARLPGGRALNC